MRDVNLDVKRGEYFVLLGPTAAGKTLLLELIAGFYVPDHGEIWINGTKATQLPPEKRNVGFVYQDYALFPHLTVRENVEFGLRLKKRSDTRTRVDQLLEEFGVSYLSERFPDTLSGGEQQKVAIARALATEPQVLLLDEPLSALDLRTQEKTRKELKKVQRDLGFTAVHVTHSQPEAMALGDRIGVMMGGELVQVGASREVFTKPTNRKIAEFLGVENILFGEIVSHQEGIATIDLGSTRIQAVTELTSGPVEVFIRPEDIILSRSPISTSARNLLECEVIEAIQEGVLARVSLEEGITALITRRSLNELEICPGCKIFATFKASAPHVIPLDKGSS
ncbi:MAG: ATP-binding cassette domain-containing protein [Methanotrichaceae archaeon]